MASYAMPSDALDNSQMMSDPSFIDYAAIEDMFNEPPTAAQQSQGQYSFIGGFSQPQDMHTMTIPSSYFLDPLPPPHKNLPPGLQRHASDSDESSHLTTPLNGIQLMSSNLSWPRVDAANFGKASAPYLEASFALSPPEESEDYAPMMGAFSVDPSLIQHFPSADSLTLTPFTNGQFSKPSSQMPSLSPVNSTDSPLICNDSTANGPTSSSSSSSSSSRRRKPIRSPVSKHNRQEPPSRKHSVHSLASQHSNGSPSGSAFNLTDEDGKERDQCHYPDCGKSFKDLKAHMLTHQNERPEKCPISSCEFHKRGFARKYDRNRHLVTTHYKATITCGFCPGEDSPAANSFNRTDIFKRHLVSAHAVDQNTSASKKRTSKGSAKQSPIRSEGSSGKCSTCGDFFPSPQELFDHLDDCISRVVIQKDPCEANNENNLRAIEDDEDVLATMQRHSLPSYPVSLAASVSGDRDSTSADPDDMNTAKCRKLNNGTSLATASDAHPHTGMHHPRQGEAGLTFSTGGRDLAVAKGRRKRKDYPQSWGCASDDMTLKKRVLCVFDGQRRLWKDDMMLGNQFEVRMQLPDGGFVTDLDVETLKRAEAFHNATEEERGSWMPTNYYSGQLPIASETHA